MAEEKLADWQPLRELRVRAGVGKGSTPLQSRLPETRPEST
jgi:hypothetical protein